MIGQATLQRSGTGSLSPDEIIRQSFQLALAAHNSGDLAQADQLYRAILAVREDHADALHGLGVLSHQIGQHQFAADFIGFALAQRDDPTFRNNHALVLLELGRPHQALTEVFKALEARPTYPQAYNALGSIQDRLGLKNEAIASYRRAIAQKPDYVDAISNLGKLLKSQGETIEAEACFNRAIALDPACVEAVNNRGALFLETRRFDEAIECLTGALAIRQDYAEAYVNRGKAWLAKKDFDRAEADLRCALALKPDQAAALGGMGVVCFQTGRVEESLDYFDRALARDERSIEALNGAGLAHYRLRHYDQARDYIDRALAQAEPSMQAELHYRLGTEMSLQEHTDEAIACFDRALAHKPEDCDILNDRAHLLMHNGDPRAALRGFEDVLRRDQQHVMAFANRLMAMHYLDDVSNADLLAAARPFGALLHRPLPDALARRERSLDPERKLRIGYVSGDYNAHPVGIFLLRVLSSHDKANVEVFCYYNNKLFDEYTEALKHFSDHWREIHQVPDDAVAAMIADDKIDILVDLSGHTAKGRVTLFGAKPAPLQVEWLGYFGTTGLPSMDYIVLDAISAPAGQDAHFVEKIVRMPHGRLCYCPPPYDIPIADPPCLERGYVTFGSFNNVVKMGESVIALWSRVLHAVPNSRLILKFKNLSNASVCERLRAAFARHDIGGDRLELRPASIHGVALQEYNDVDIGLDPFPFGGGTTSCEALWMGVPVVTLPVERLASRQTLSFLHFMGHADLAATSPDDYLARAVALANDPERLRALRPRLRQDLVSAPFVDGKRFTAELESAYREMWRRHVAGEAPAAFDVAG